MARQDRNISKETRQDDLRRQQEIREYERHYAPIVAAVTHAGMPDELSQQYGWKRESKLVVGVQTYEHLQTHKEMHITLDPKAPQLQFLSSDDLTAKPITMQEAVTKSAPHQHVKEPSSPKDTNAGHHLVGGTKEATRERIYSPAEYERHYVPLNRELHTEDVRHFAWRAETGTVQTYQHEGTHRHIHIEDPAASSLTNERTQLPGKLHSIAPSAWAIITSPRRVSPKKPRSSGLRYPPSYTRSHHGYLQPTCDVAPKPKDAYLLRIWCSNLAITQEEMRQVHPGKPLDESMLYSNRTYELDARATISALKDVIKGQLDAASLSRRMEAVRHSNDQDVSPQKSKETFRRMLQKGESEAALQAFESPGTYNLPAGHTNWRLSNAISWIAGQTKDAERKLELMKAAGDVLPKAA